MVWTIVPLKRPGPAERQVHVNWCQPKEALPFWGFEGLRMNLSLGSSRPDVVSQALDAFGMSPQVGF